MKNIYTKNKKKSRFYGASALAYGLIIMTVTMIILVSMLSYISSQLKFSFNRVEKEEAFQIAEAGVYYYRWYLAHQTSGKTVQQVNDFWQNGNPLGVSTPFEADYEGIGKYKIEVTAPQPSSTIVTVKSTGWTYKMPGVTRKVQVRFRRPSWSEYMFLSNSFMNFGEDAKVWGKVYSNTGIRFDGVAHNTVSALPAKFYDPTHGGCKEFGVHTHSGTDDPCAPATNPPWPDNTVPDRADVFMGGREFPVPEVSFTGVTTDLSNMKSQAQAGSGKYFDKSGAGRKITLKTDGTYDVCTVDDYNSNSKDIQDYLGVITGATGSYSGTNGNSCSIPSCCSGSSCPYVQSSKPAKGRCVSLANYNIVNDGVIFVENNVWLEGSVNNKRVSVVAANLSGGNQSDIYIGISNSNIRYAAYDCNNMIGLVAQRDVRVLNNCPSNFIVDAALLAQSGLVGIVTGMGGKYSLTFNGAIASYLEPYFLSGNSGFSDRTYNFNNNLLYCPPPYFPTGTDYSIDLWEEL